MGNFLPTPEEVIKPDFVYGTKTSQEQASYARLAQRNAKLVEHAKELVMLQADSLDEHIQRLRMVSTLMRKTAGNNFAMCEDHQAAWQLGRSMDTRFLQMREAVNICNAMHGLLDHGIDEEQSKLFIKASMDKIAQLRASEEPSHVLQDILQVLSSIFR